MTWVALEMEVEMEMRGCRRGTGYEVMIYTINMGSGLSCKCSPFPFVAIAECLIPIA